MIENRVLWHIYIHGSSSPRQIERWEHNVTVMNFTGHARRGALARPGPAAAPAALGPTAAGRLDPVLAAAGAPLAGPGPAGPGRRRVRASGARASASQI